MTVTVTPVGVGTTGGDGTGDLARTAFQSLNANEANFKAAVESLQGRFWTVRNTTLNPLVMGARYIANNHAGIVFTLPSVFAVSATAESDIWIANADDAASVTLTPASGDALFVAGVTLGVDATYALTFGKIAILSPRTTDSEWDVVLTSSGGGLTNWEESGTTLQPKVAGYNLGSTTNELGDIFLSDSKSVWFGSAQDLRITRDAANTLAQRNTTNAQTFHVYNTWTDASNYERGFMRWTANQLEIGSESAGTGTGRALKLYAGDTNKNVFADVFTITGNTAGASQGFTITQNGAGRLLKFQGGSAGGGKLHLAERGSSSSPAWVLGDNSPGLHRDTTNPPNTCTIEAPTGYTSGAAGGSIRITAGDHEASGSVQGSVFITNADNTTKIFECTESKVGFFAETPVAKQATTGTVTGFTAGSGTAANDDSTYTGNSGTTAYTVGDIVLALKNYGLLTA